MMTFTERGITGAQAGRIAELARALGLDWDALDALTRRLLGVAQFEELDRREASVLITALAMREIEGRR
jgi:hypothetical protein